MGLYALYAVQILQLYSMKIHFMLLGEKEQLFLQQILPYAHYFAVVHDSWVGTLTNMGINDWIVNIPTMPIAAIYAVNKVNYNMYLNTIAIITKKLGSPNPLPCCIKE